MSDSTATGQEDDREGSDDTAEKPGDVELSEEEREAIEADREERLAQENRPETAEVDNSERDFDAETGMFTDSEGYDEAAKTFLPDEEL